MSKVFINIGLSLDGYMAPEGMTLEHWDTPDYKEWASKWRAMMGWLTSLKYFRENLFFAEGRLAEIAVFHAGGAPQAASTSHVAAMSSGS